MSKINKKKRGKTILLIGILLFGFMLLSLIMMSNALHDSDRFDNLFLYLLFFNALGLLTLITLIALNLKRLSRQIKNRSAGAFMTLRMVAMFSVLSIIPLLILYYFSLDFLLRGIDNWFDLRVEQALEDSLELSRLSLDERMRELLKQTEQVAEELSDISDAETPFEIDELRVRTGAEELTLLTRQGSILASSASNSSSLVPNHPDETILLQLQQGSSYTGLDPVDESGLFIRVVVNIPDILSAQTPRIVQALFPVTERINILANNVQTAFVDYQELSYLREQLKLSFVMVLTLVLLFSIFSVIWAAFYSAKKLAQPIKDLAEGTRAVAEGHYHTQLPVTSRDELGFLLASFNDMTQGIAKARDDVEQSQKELESQRSRLATILDKMTSGVLVFDQEQKLQTANNSAQQILAIKLQEQEEKSMMELAKLYPNLEHLFLTIINSFGLEDTDWREHVTFLGNSGRQDLMLSGTILSLDTAVSSGYIIVFDDITALVQGQKDAAWGEMARRLAHEIKNPLTPIQLAAERLRHKYLATLPEQDAEILDRLTNTIVQQVETMKGMVNSFSDYARIPAMEPSACDLNQLLQEVVDLFRNNKKSVAIEMELETELPLANVDPKRLRQVFNNLIKNAVDASQPDSKIHVSSQLLQEHELDSIKIRIRDSGKGIDDNIQEKIFDPYVTTKSKGTGLGLAIVKKIIEEHGGVVWLKNNEHTAGASATIKLPLQTLLADKSKKMSISQ